MSKNIFPFLRLFIESLHSKFCKSLMVIKKINQIIISEWSKLLNKFSGPIFSFLSFAFLTDSGDFGFNDFIFSVFLHFIYNEHIFQNDFKFIIIFNSQKEINQFILNDWNMFVLKKSWGLEHTDFNKFDNQITILKILIISDHLNESLR